MENAVLQRIKKFVKIKNLSVNAFSKAINMEQPTVNNYFLERRGISFEIIDKMLTTFPELSAEWLLRGIEPMIISQIMIENNGSNSGIIGIDNKYNSAVDIEIYKQQLKEKDAQIASLTTILTNLTNKQS